MGGITRIHGNLVAPKNFAGVTLRDYTLQFWNGDAYLLAADAVTPAGALDQVFKTATGNVGTLSRIGIVTTGTGATANYVRFAIEMLGAEYGEAGYLGTGPDNAGQGDAEATPALALQAAIRALGDTGTSASTIIHLTSATVTAFLY